jgi:heme-degrading monooxygenase HmoA
MSKKREEGDILISPQIAAKRPHMIVVENHIPVNAKFRGQFEERWTGGTRYVQDSPGFVRNEVLRPIKGDEHYIVRTYWRSQEDFESWAKSEEFAKAHKDARNLPDEMFAGKSFLTVHEVISATEGIH